MEVVPHPALWPLLRVPGIEAVLVEVGTARRTCQLDPRVRCWLGWSHCNPLRVRRRTIGGRNQSSESV